MKSRTKVATFLLQLFMVMLPLFLISCGENKDSPQYVARLYLTALKNKDWDEAKKYCSDGAMNNLDAAIRIGMPIEITDVRNIRCKVKDGQAVCTFCCVEGDPQPIVRLSKGTEGWVIAGGKEAGNDQFIPNLDSLGNQFNPNLDSLGGGMDSL
jgi:hypothetical protein